MELKRPWSFLFILFFLARDTSSGVLEGFFNFFPGIAPSCHFKSMLIYRNHKQLKTNTSHNERALSVTIHTGESGKKYWFSLFLLIKSKNYILLTELAEKQIFCLTLGQTGTGVLSNPWPLCLSHHFFVILYITCHILFFLYRTECKITYSHDH